MVEKLDGQQYIADYGLRVVQIHMVEKLQNHSFAYYPRLRVV